jgi:hypothetical protein
LGRDFVFLEKAVPCDTDFFALISASDFKDSPDENIENILQTSLQDAAKEKDFDFEISTLRAYKKTDGKSQLVLHTQVYGGAKSLEDRMDYLIQRECGGSRIPHPLGWG